MSTDNLALNANAEGRGFLIEWKGEKHDALAVVKHGKVMFRLADKRLLGRATVIGQLIRPGDVAGTERPVWDIQSSADTASTDSLGDTPPEPADEGVAGDSTAETAQSGHWADDAPPVVSDEPAPTGRPASVTAVGESSAGDVPAPKSSEDAVMLDWEVREEGAAWVAVTGSGATEFVCDTTTSIADLDVDIEVIERSLTHLRAVRAKLIAGQAREIAIAIERLAAADGVDNPESGTVEQRAAWRRYAAVLVGE